jgi:hypothetical protein
MAVLVLEAIAAVAAGVADVVVHAAVVVVCDECVLPLGIRSLWMGGSCTPVTDTKCFMNDRTSNAIASRASYDADNAESRNREK